MNKQYILLACMTLLGISHVITFLYLRKTGKRQEVYEELKVSKWIIISLLIVGLMLGGIYNDNKMQDASTTAKYTVAIGATLVAPLAILGLVWVKLIGDFILSAIANIFEK